MSTTLQFFLVLACGDFPIVANSRHISTATPWLPGSKVTYSCNVGYEFKFRFKSDNSSTIECVVDTEKKTAEWSDSTNIFCTLGMIVSSIEH